MSFTPLFNQIGFYPDAPKTVIIPGSSSFPLEVFDDCHRVLAVKPQATGVWPYSGEMVQRFDLSHLKKTGTYYLYRDEKNLGLSLVVDKMAYQQLAKGSLKWFYYQRASMALEPEYAGKWSRAAGHKDDCVKVYGDPARLICASKGWYDAGDYGKYIVNCGITVFTLLQIFEDFPEYAKTLKWNIPRDEQIPSLPDLLCEIKYNLDWMLSMQDSDGSVFHKLTALKFCPHYAPDLDTADRYVIGKTTTAALNFAGNMAQASLIYSKYDEEYAKRMLLAAEKAWVWAKKHPTEFYRQPSDVNTGQYTPLGENGKPSFKFAAVELFRATGKQEYLEELNSNPLNEDPPWWGNLNLLAVYHVARNESDENKSGKNKAGGHVPYKFPEPLVQKAREILLQKAYHLCDVSKNSIYHVAMNPEDWTWGSNAVACNNGIIFLQGFYLTKNLEYLHAAHQILDYILGKNPLDICYVTGFGKRSPLHPHHRPSEGDNIEEPVPGMMAGGPHLGGQDVKREPDRVPDYTLCGKPALAYLDHEASFATNEVAINWNAPLAYLATALDAIYNLKTHT